MQVNVYTLIALGILSCIFKLLVKYIDTRNAKCVPPGY
jgi:hypothetical protein